MKLLRELQNTVIKPVETKVIVKKVHTSESDLCNGASVRDALWNTWKIVKIFLYIAFFCCYSIIFNNFIHSQRK